MAKNIMFGTKIILQVSSINIYMAGVTMRTLVLTLLTFKKVKLIFKHPVYEVEVVKLCHHTFSISSFLCTLSLLTYFFLHSVADAEHLPVDDESVDLVTVSQAAHWLNFPAFCKEVDRVLTPHGCLAVYARNHLRLLHDDDGIANRLNGLIISVSLYFMFY